MQTLYIKILITSYQPQRRCAHGNLGFFFNLLAHLSVTLNSQPASCRSVPDNRIYLGLSKLIGCPKHRIHSKLSGRVIIQRNIYDLQSGIMNGNYILHTEKNTAAYWFYYSIRGRNDHTNPLRKPHCLCSVSACLHDAYASIR